jgi:NTE family protein
MTRVGLVLGAGGIVGQAYHAGVLAALAEHGWDPASSEIVVGTSAGSLVAGLLRRGISVADLGSGRYRRGEVSATGRPEAMAGAYAAGEAARARPRLGRVRIGSRIAGMLPAGRVSPGGIITLLRRVGGDDWPRATTWICAVARDGGKRVVFGSAGAPPASLPQAVAASCAIPAYFQPVRIGDQEYMDGGAHSPTNLDLLAGRGLDLVVAVSPMSFSGSPSPRLDVGARLLFRGMLAREVLAVRRRGTAVLTLQPGSRELDVMGLNAMSPARWSEVVEESRTAARRQLASASAARLLRRLAGTPADRLGR